MSNQVNYNVVNKTSSVTFDNESISFAGKSGYEYLTFDKLESKPTKITFSATFTSGDKFGLAFNATNKQYGPLNIVFDLQKQKIHFYNVDQNRINSSTPQASVDFNMKLNESFDVTIISENECITVYVNDQIALTTRMYSKSNNYFGLFTKFSGVTIKNLSFYE